MAGAPPPFPASAPHSGPHPEAVCLLPIQHGIQEHLPGELVNGKHALGLLVHTGALDAVDDAAQWLLVGLDLPRKEPGWGRCPKRQGPSLFLALTPPPAARPMTPKMCCPQGPSRDSPAPALPPGLPPSPFCAPLTCTRGYGRRLWFSDTLMGGITQALRTRPGAGARCQGYRVLGLLCPGTPNDRPRLCNKSTISCQLHSTQPQ